MKRKLLFAMLCIVSVLGLKAQTWNPSSLTDGGKYVFYNVGSGRYFGPGNSWGTQASLIECSHYNTVHKQSDGVYKIESQVSNGGTNYYFTGSYMDGAAVNVTIKDDGNGIFTMSDGGTNYYGYNGSSTVLASNLTDPTNANAQWKIMAYDAVYADASELNPVDVTYMILDATFDRNNRNGGGSNNDLGNKWTMEASNQNLCGGDNTNCCAESWQSAFTLSQTITVPNGYYKLRAQAALTEYTVTGANFPVVYATSGANTVSTPFLTMQNGENSMSAMSTQFTNGNYFTNYTDVITVSNGSLTVGTKGTRTDTWCIWDNFQLLYMGPIDLSAYETELANAVSAAEAYESQLPAAVYANIASVITAQNQSWSTEEDYSAAITAINNAVSTYATSAIIADYARYNSIKTAAKAISNDVNTTSADAAVAAATTTDAIDAAIVTLREALGTYLTGAGIENDEIDLTAALIDNASPGTAGNTNYWTNSNNPGLQYNLYEFYNIESASSKQTIATELPVGYYRMTVIGYTRTGYNGYFYAGDNQQTLVGVAKETVNDRNGGNSWIALGNGVNEMIFNLTSATSDLEIGINSGNASGDKWTCWRSFKLEYLGTAPLVMFQQNLADAATAANAHATALDGTIPTAAKTAYTSAISTAAADNTTVDKCLASIAAIETATATADALVAPYAKYSSLQSSVQALYDVSNYEELVSGSHSTLGSALSTAATNVADATDIDGIESVISTLKAAGVTYAGAANPTEDATFNLTFMLTNPDLTNCTGWAPADGWYTDQEFAGQNSQVMNDNDAVANTADPSLFAMYEYWSGNKEATSGYTVYLKVTLPEGTYRMDALCLAGYGSGNRFSSGQNITFSANDIDGTSINTTTLEPATIEFVQTSEGLVKIGLKAHSGNTSNWMGIGYVELYKVPAADPVVLDESAEYDYSYSGAATAKLTRTIYAGFNTVMLPFSLSADEMETVFGSGTLYQFDDADAGVLNFTTSSTLQANTPYLYKADASKDIDELSIEGRTFVAAASAQVVDAGTDYNFVGTYTPYAKGESPIVVGTDYVLGSDNCFHQATVKNALKAFRAYIQANEASEVRALRIVLDDEVTAIEAIDNKALSGNAAIYNVAGQRVNKAVKGLYIVNGKKVVIK